MTRKNPERSQELLAAAQQLFFKKGYENTSVNDIIKAVGVSKGAFYHHFESKAAVLEAAVTQMVRQAVTNIQAVTGDESLTAIPKWQKMVRISNNWKIERKAEIIATHRLMRMDENILFRHKIRSKMDNLIATEMGKIIMQGVEEGVFHVERIAETTAILMAVIETLNETAVDLLLNPDHYEDRVTIALQKNAAVQTAVERILDAPAGSMSIIDDKTLIAWLTD